MRIVGKRQFTVGKRMAFNAILVLLLFVVCCLSSVSAQSISATLKSDSSKISIGDHLHVKLTVKHSKDYLVAIPPAIDTLGNMEIVKVDKIDTTSEGGNTVLSQGYTVSAYDSGQFHAGPVKIFFKNTAGNIDSISSNDILVDVSTVAVDTSKPFKAIKAPLDVSYSWQEFIAYIIAGVLLLVIASTIFTILYLRNKNKPKVVARPRPKDPAHIWARKELKKLEDEKLWHDNPKMYYSRLTDILRLYLEYRFNWMALESTTEEISKEIGNFEINDVAKAVLLEILRASDLVKFAKMTPMPDANIRAMESAKRFIDMTAQVEAKPEIKK